MFFLMALRNAVLHLRGGIAVALSAAAATAVLVGAAIVGHSVDGSLMDMAKERLGRVEYSVSAPHFFPEDLADRLKKNIGGGVTAPVIIVNATVKNTSNNVAAQDVQIVGCDERFFSFFPDADRPRDFGGRKCAISRSLSKAIIFLPNENILITLQKSSLAPSGSVFGKKKTKDTTISLRLEPQGAMPLYSSALFNLKNETGARRTVLVPLETLQNAMEIPGKINTVLINTGGATAKPSEALSACIKMSDLGLKLVNGGRDDSLFLESDDLMLTENQLKRAADSARSAGLLGENISVYLVRSMNGKAPYSVIAGAEKHEVPPEGMLLSGWAAEDTGSSTGSTISAMFIKSRSNGSYYEEPEVFSDAGAMPVRYLDREMVPKFEGITDSASMAEWKPPFPLDKGAIRPKDESYWTKEGAAPKALVNYKKALSFWQVENPAYSGVTSFRVERHSENSAAAFQKAYLNGVDPGPLGLALRAEKDEAEKSAVASSDYSSLFAGLSFFVVASALMLVWLIFGIMAEDRSKEAGTLLALGFKPGYIIRLLALESAIYSFLGVFPGIFFGFKYADVFTDVLTSGWKESGVEIAVFRVHMDTPAVIIWASAAFVLSVLAATFSARRVLRNKVIPLLSGSSRLPDIEKLKIRDRRSFILASGFAALALVFTVLGTLKLVSPVASFFLGGTLLLVALLLFFTLFIKGRPAISITGLALRSIYAGRKRSILAASLIACAAFMLVAVSSNKREPGESEMRDMASGSGGYNIVATSGIPIYFDLNSPFGREAAGIKEDEYFTGSVFMPFFVRRGEDMSCLNIATPKEPTVYGVPRTLIERGGFTLSSKEGWKALDAQIEGAVPAFADSNSLEWILHKQVGDTVMVGGRVLKIVGTVQESVFANAILISEENFTKIYPARGRGFFLVDCPDKRERDVLKMLNRDFADLGFDARKSSELLMRFAGIQNIYIATFELLGGLGFLLGIFGLTGVLLKNVSERGRELAAMRAFGFTPVTLIRLVVIENAMLLVCGLFVGTIASFVAVFPPAIISGRYPVVSGAFGYIILVFVAGFLASVIGAALAMRRTAAEALRNE